MRVKTQPSGGPGYAPRERRVAHTQSMRGVKGIPLKGGGG